MSRAPSRLLLSLVVAALAPAACTPSSSTTNARGQPLQVAAASDLQPAFEELARRFTQAGGPEVAFSFGSSGQLSQRLVQGGPYDVFASADIALLDDPIRADVCDATTKRAYARGRLAVWWRPDLQHPPTSLHDLDDPRFARIAIANPAHAPYGRAAREALERSSVWSSIASRVVFADNVRQAQQFVQSGNADVALLARSLVNDDDAHLLEVDGTLFSPLVQGLVVCRRGHNAAQADAFVRLVTSSEGRDVLARHGFLPPPDDLGAPRP